LQLAEEKVAEFCARVRKNLAVLCLDEKREALKALQVQVIVAEGQLKIRGIVPADFSYHCTNMGMTTCM